MYNHRQILFGDGTTDVVKQQRASGGTATKVRIIGEISFGNIVQGKHSLASNGTATKVQRTSERSGTILIPMESPDRNDEIKY